MPTRRSRVPDQRPAPRGQAPDLVLRARARSAMRALGAAAVRSWEVRKEDLVSKEPGNHEGNAVESTRSLEK